MPEALVRLQHQAAEIWNEMDKSQKTRMIIIAILVVASVSLAIFVVTRPSYERLFSGGIDPKEIGEMSKVLKDSKIDHRLADSGTSIEVKEKDKDMAQLALAQSGFPRGGMTFQDALGSIKLSTTESDKKKIYGEYDEQKIARTLEKIQYIRDAEVDISKPETESFFGAQEKNQTKAGVMIEATEELSKKQVDGIVRFVAASVEGLDPKYVTVIDNLTGKPLNSSGEDDLAGITSSQFEIQSNWKREIESKVFELFNNEYDGVKVAANVICDFNAESTKEVQYNPPIPGEDGGILRSSEEHKEEVTNGSTGGVPGTDSNTANGATPTYPSGDASGSSYKKTDKIDNYEINQKNIDRTKAIGQPDLEKSSITVSFMYGKRVAAAPTQEQLDQATNMIAKATGISNKNIAIASFKIPEVKIEAPKTDWMKLLGQIGPIAVLGILILLLAIGIMRRGQNINRELAFNGPKLSPNMAGIEGEDLPEIDLEEKSEVKKQIDKFVKTKPDAVASLLRNWLADDWD